MNTRMCVMIVSLLDVGVGEELILESIKVCIVEIRNVSVKG